MNSHRSALFFDLEKLYDCVCVCVFAQTHETGSGTRFHHAAATHSHEKRTSASVILREGEMVEQSVQLSNRALAGWSLGNRFARVVLYNILECVNNTLPAQLSAPVEMRQFVDDLTTMMASSEDDVTDTSPVSPWSYEMSLKTGNSL